MPYGGSIDHLDSAPHRSFHELPWILELNHSCDWGSVGEYLVGSMLSLTSNSQRRCSARPDGVCTVHPCKCGKCGPDGLECTWRKLCTDLLKDQDLANRMKQGIGKGNIPPSLRASRGDGLHSSVLVCFSSCMRPCASTTH